MSNKKNYKKNSENNIAMTRKFIIRKKVLKEPELLSDGSKVGGMTPESYMRVSVELDGKYASTVMRRDMTQAIDRWIDLAKKKMLNE
jgi:hypothetical protein